MFQAEQGDCFLLSYGRPKHPRYLLVDGGPGGTYERRLRPYLRRRALAGRGIDRVLLSHVDDDHVDGLLDLLREIRRERPGPEGDGRSPARYEGAPTTQVGGLWHNSFEASAGSPILAPTPSQASMPLAQRSIAQGDALRLAAEELGIPINADFGGGLLSLEESRPVALENLLLRIVGPTRENLEELRRDWMEWHERRRGRTATVAPDESVPNLSSIVVLAEADGRSALLTGDARGDHILQGLGKAGVLGADGRLHVSVLKVQHHGSERNISPEFLRLVTADVYAISANGKHGNPDLRTLQWIVDAADADGRQIRIITTNETESTRELQRTRSPGRYGYRMRILRRTTSSTALPLR